MLYFIKSGNYCKVGYTKDSKAFFDRMRKYLTHNPSFQILGKRIRSDVLHAFLKTCTFAYSF